ncbi:hypothetical protein OS493_022162 [Desmophyllum pertusum]|uniref:Uncharacterized protein n=1 Tax=Desmophyllum pertusum TaxID=174260 RepID=A0A9W9YMH0_9CNID|nr:hypothetical protein OS493_022162 [Desmophyllum pertusum]
MADEEEGLVEENIDGLSHPEVMSLFNEKLSEIMCDPLLIGLPMSLLLMSCCCHPNATVHDLKKAIQRPHLAEAVKRRRSKHCLLVRRLGSMAFKIKMRLLLSRD